MTKQALTTEQLVLKAALEEFYGAAIPDDEVIRQTEPDADYQIMPLYADEKMLITYVGTDRDGAEKEMQIVNVTQNANPFYGQDMDDEGLSGKGYEEVIELVSERVDENGKVDYYQSGRTRRWVQPTLKPGHAA